MPEGLGDLAEVSSTQHYFLPLLRSTTHNRISYPKGESRGPLGSLVGYVKRPSVEVRKPAKALLFLRQEEPWRLRAGYRVETTGSEAQES